MSISESRAAAAGTHLRVPYANSSPRRIKIIGLGDQGERIVQAIGRRGLADVDVINPGGAAPDHAETMVRDIADSARDLHRQLQEANMIFMIAFSGENVEFAPVVSRVAHELGKCVTCILIEPQGASPPSGAATLDVLRACADMLVIGTDESYLDEMLNALGATDR